MDRNLSSFRDPSGYIFKENGEVYRRINKSYFHHLEFLTSSGLLGDLQRRKLLVDHEVMDSGNESEYITIKPSQIPVITYPYEWSFSQLKHAALHTLEVMETSIKFGMILKDATAFNIQFLGYKPVFIDTLSFEVYNEGEPWIAYRQFCEHFLNPLMLSAHLSVDYQYLNKIYIDGIPLKVASELLPKTSWFKPGALFHVHLHNKSVAKHGQSGVEVRKGGTTISKNNLVALLDHLKNVISDLKLKKSLTSQWKDYDKEIHYSETGRVSKAKIIREFVDKVKPSVLWDIGANDGHFSRSVAQEVKTILSIDSDYLAVEKNYQEIKRSKIENIIPLVQDITNPSPGIGWANTERLELVDRSKPDLIMALALVHHLAISNNIPFDFIARYFSSISEWLIIEFVPEDDIKVKMLPNTAGKENYSRITFDNGFALFFDLISERKVDDSERSLLLMRNRNK